LASGENVAQYRGTEHDAGEELAHDWRLAPTGEELPQQTPDEQEHHDLREENGGRCAQFRRMQAGHPGNFPDGQSSGPARGPPCHNSSMPTAGGSPLRSIIASERAPGNPSGAAAGSPALSYAG